MCVLCSSHHVEVLRPSHYSGVRIGKAMAKHALEEFNSVYHCLFLSLSAYLSLASLSDEAVALCLHFVLSLSPIPTPTRNPFTLIMYQYMYMHNAYIFPKPYTQTWADHIAELVVSRLPTHLVLLHDLAVMSVQQVNHDINLSMSTGIVKHCLTCLYVCKCVCVCFRERERERA